MSVVAMRHQERVGHGVVTPCCRGMLDKTHCGPLLSETEVLIFPSRVEQAPVDQVSRSRPGCRRVVSRACSCRCLCARTPCGGGVARVLLCREQFFEVVDDRLAVRMRELEVGGEAVVACRHVELHKVRHQR